MNVTSVAFIDISCLSNWQKRSLSFVLSVKFHSLTVSCYPSLDCPFSQFERSFDFMLLKLECWPIPTQMRLSSKRTEDQYLYVACRSICDHDQVFWSAKSVLDRLIVPFWGSWLLDFQGSKVKLQPHSWLLTFDPSRNASTQDIRDYPLICDSSLTQTKTVMQAGFHLVRISLPVQAIMKTIHTRVGFVSETKTSLGWTLTLEPILMFVLGTKY